MRLNERQTKIVEVLKERKRMSVVQLAKQFFVSEMTIRRDLKLLEEESYIVRYNGGAMIKNGDGDIMPIKYRRLLHIKQKTNLAKMAEKYLKDSINVFIDSSSTCMYIIPLIAEHKDIHIFTNSVQTVIAAAERGIKCTLIGGNYYKYDMCTVGSIAEEFLRGINADIAFFSSAGLSDDGFITDHDELQTAIRKIVMSKCDTNIFLFDNHKLHKKYIYTLCHKDDVTETFIL